MKKGAKIALFSTFSILSAAAIAGNIVAFDVVGIEFIRSALIGKGVQYGDEETEKKGSELVKKISESGTVLLKNENNCLPLNIEENKNINVFGYTALDNAWVFTGVGSGSCKPDPNKRVGILSALKKAGFNYNEEIIKKYEEAIPSNDPWMSMNKNGYIIQPDSSFYSDDLINNAKKFSDTAVVVLSRISGENVGEIPSVSKDYLTGEVDSTRTYLDLAKKEENMLNIVKKNFKKVIVLLNTTNNMQCDFLKSDDIDAALFVGPTGLCGTESVANLLKGKKTVTKEDGTSEEVLISPSGKLSDTYAANYSQEPVFANRYVRNKSATGGNIVYQEDLYFGYRWYETADKEGYFDGLTNGYYDAVIYPFGYGLSYTTFDWSVKEINVKNNSSFDKDTKFEVKVAVTNTGNYPGRDVVELYYSTPYTKGGIEKSAISLGNFAKTGLLAPGETQIVSLNLDAYEMTSYDAYDKNNNGNKGYELDKGTYELSLRQDVHTLKDMKENTFTYSLNETALYQKDPTTNYDVINRFTGEDAYASVSIDGSNVGINETYLSRNDFLGTFKDKQSALPKEKSKVDKARIYATKANDQEEMPKFGVDKELYIVTKSNGSRASYEELKKSQDLKFNDALIDELTKDYNSDLWNDLVSQASKEEVKTLVERSGFGSEQIYSIGKPRTLDFDGPSGFNENTQKVAEDKSLWTSYPAECVVGCTFDKELANETGKSMAFEASKSGINGWYAPGVNLHRSNYNGRNYEYYSEDPILSGKLASATIIGAKSGGLYCYLKHFALSEEGDNAKGVDTWITEQNFRELYLKPFEICVKNGANAIMTAFNRIGPIWAGANYDLCTEILRKEWGFVGSVVTDWSSGDEIMNTNRGVLAGNDLWLNPLAQNGSPLDTNNATEMYCAKEALKHNLYTYISTYKYARDYDPENDDYKVEIGVIKGGDVVDWVTPTIIGIDVVTIGGFLVSGFYLFVLPIIKKKIAK
mgnify:CR=1 FL=1